MVDMKKAKKKKVIVKKLLFKIKISKLPSSICKVKFKLKYKIEVHS